MLGMRPLVAEKQRGFVGGTNIHENTLHQVAGVEVHAHVLVPSASTILLDSLEAFVSAEHQ